MTEDEVTQAEEAERRAFWQGVGIGIGMVLAVLALLRVAVEVLR